MKKALIFQGNLIQIEDVNFPVSSEMKWIDVANDVTTVTHIYNGVTVVTRPTETVEQKRKALKPLSPAQVRLVLDQFGLLAQVETAVAVGDKKLKLEWEFRTEFARDNVTLLGMATALGMTPTQVDSMFEIGATL